MSNGAVTILVAALTLSACSWPGFGKGGMDEVYRFKRTETVDPEWSARHERAHRLAEKLDRLRVDIDAAWRGPEGKHRPAGMMMIEKQWNRAAREWQGDMLDDAESSLSLLSANFRDLREELRQSLINASPYQPASI